MTPGESQNAAAVRQQLVQLVQAHGQELLDDSRRVRAMLADAVAGATAEANLIGLALSSGVPAKLRESSVADAAAELERTSSVQSADARWAVSAIAEALGISAAPPVPPPATASPAPVLRPGPGLAGPNDLVVHVAGQEHVVHAGSQLTIGRDPNSTVVLESTAVSRQHGRVQQGASGWEYVDLDSTQGSFVNGARVRTHALRGETTVVLGQGSDSVQVRLSPFGQANTVLPPGTPAPGRAAATEVPQRPGGALGSAPSAKTEVGGGGGGAPALKVTLGSTTRSVAAGASLSVGRETDNGLVATATTVSRHHLKIDGASGQWRLRDLGSTSGTWENGRRVTDVQLSGRQEFVLGDPDTGDKLVTEAPGVTVSKPAAAAGKRGVPALAAAAVVAIIALVAGGFFVIRALNEDDGGGENPPVALTPDQLAQGTVQIRTNLGSGSGTVIDKKLGLILTNAHVAAPASVGSAIASGYQFFRSTLKNPTRIDIAVAAGIGEPARLEFTGEVVAADGYLDLAVVKITKTTEGAFVEPQHLANLVEVPIGDSDTVQATDELSVIGYPGSQESLGPTFSSNVVSGYSADERVGTNRGWINSTDVVAHGNSGGLAANAAGQLVGVPSLLRYDNLVSPGYEPDYTTVGSAMRPVNLARDLIAAAKSGQEYTSPYVTAAPKTAKIRGLHQPGLVEPQKPGSITDKCNSDSGSGTYAFGIDYEGFSGGDHTDVVALFQDAETGDVIDWTVTDWKTKLPKKGCMGITTNLTSLPAGVEITIAVGGDMIPIWNVVIS